MPNPSCLLVVECRMVWIATVSPWLAVHLLSLLLPLAILFVPELLFRLLLLIVVCSQLVASYFFLVWLPLQFC
jgi:hypothetical protein